jgi:small subunit ribosomal protein S11
MTPCRRSDSGTDQPSGSDALARLARESTDQNKPRVSSASALASRWANNPSRPSYSSSAFLKDTTRPPLPTVDSFLEGFTKRSIPSLTAETLPHKLSVYATKHNCHITLTTPPEKDSQGNFGTRVLISVSCGNIGFRKAGRGSYDAAYQLAAFVLSRVKDRGWLPQIQKLEVCFRGFGPGRDAVSQALMGLEGKNLKGLITMVTDATRLKFGGTRSRAPRRLG